MLIFPVIDIKDGKCVRTIEGLKEKTEYYLATPLRVAKLFRKENFKSIHITDLDGARQGEMKNLNVIKEIAESLDIPIQLGGGIRNYDVAQKMLTELNVFRLVIGTGALDNPDMVREIINNFGSEKVVIGIDEKLNNVVKNGWIDYADITPLDFAKYAQSLGVERIIYQDVTRVGNLCGANIERLIEIANNTKLKITAAGGICNYRNLKEIIDLKINRIDSVMISRALYENKFPCQKLWRELEKEDISLTLPDA